MNRLDRRNLKRKSKTKNLVLIPGVDKVDHRNDNWCHLHQLQLENIDHPTSRDKILIAAVAYKTIKKTGDNGEIIIEKICPKCYQVIHINTVNKPLLRG